jgi:hypothetical protein
MGDAGREEPYVAGCQVIGEGLAFFVDGGETNTAVQD